MSLHIGKKADGAEQIDGCGKPKGAVVAEVFGSDASCQHAESEPCVPRYEQRGVGSAPLCVWCKVDEHCLESGVHVSATQTDN